MPIPEAIALLTDIGTEELAHLEILSTLVYRLTSGASTEELKEAGFDAKYVESGG
jgi:spore coat protein JC